MAGRGFLQFSSTAHVMVTVRRGLHRSRPGQNRGLTTTPDHQSSARAPRLGGVPPASSRRAPGSDPQLADPAVPRRLTIPPRHCTSSLGKEVQPVPETPSPVAILHQGSSLVVSIGAALDDSQMVRFRQELAVAISWQGVRGVLIDVASLDVLDSFGSRTIRDVAELARLRGARAVIVGVHPDLAWAMVHLGIDAGDIPTAHDLDDGLDLVSDLRRSVGRCAGASAPRVKGVGTRDDERSQSLPAGRLLPVRGDHHVARAPRRHRPADRSHARFGSSDSAGTAPRPAPRLTICRRYDNILS